MTTSTITYDYCIKEPVRFSMKAVLTYSARTRDHSSGP